MWINIKKISGEVIRFAIVGTIATAINWGVYWVLQHWVNVNIAYTAGFLLSILCNYLLSSYFTFRKPPTIVNVVGFALAHTAAFFIRLALLNLFIFLGVRQDIAPIPVDCVAIPINFILVKLGFSFNKQKKQK